VETHKTVVLISGATGVIGQAIARGLAATPNYAIVLLARDEARASKAVETIRRNSGNDDVDFVIADVSRRRSIETLANSWDGPLHVLVNDAGIAPRDRAITAEGIEKEAGARGRAEMHIETLRVENTQRRLEAEAHGIEAKAGAEQTSIHRKTGMQMCITPENLVRKTALGIGRIGLAGIEV